MAARLLAATADRLGRLAWTDRARRRGNPARHALARRHSGHCRSSHGTRHRVRLPGRQLAPEAVGLGCGSGRRDGRGGRGECSFRHGLPGPLRAVRWRRRSEMHCGSYRWKGGSKSGRAHCTALQDFPFTGVGLGTFRRVVNLLTRCSSSPPTSTSRTRTTSSCRWAWTSGSGDWWRTARYYWLQGRWRGRPYGEKTGWATSRWGCWHADRAARLPWLDALALGSKPGWRSGWRWGCSEPWRNCRASSIGQGA